MIKVTLYYEDNTLDYSSPPSKDVFVKNEEEFSIAISPETYFTENDKLLVLGEYRALQKCFRI